MALVIGFPVFIMIIISMKFVWLFLFYNSYKDIYFILSICNCKYLNSGVQNYRPTPEIYSINLSDEWENRMDLISYNEAVLTPIIKKKSLQEETLPSYQEFFKNELKN